MIPETEVQEIKEELGDFSVGIIDYVIHRKTNNLASLAFPGGGHFDLELSKYLIFVKSIYFSYISKKMNNRKNKSKLCNVK